MKISPIASNSASGQPGTAIGSIEVGKSASSERLAAAKAIAAGQNPMKITPSDTPVDPQVTRTQNSIRKIKMRTQVSPDRIYDTPAPVSDEIVEENTTNVVQESATNDPSVTQASEETKPLSPQLAALAKQRRALQVKERELAEREAKLTAQPNGNAIDLAKLQADPLGVLREAGALTPTFYQSLTDQLLAEQSGINPEIQALKKEIAALKEGVDKTLSDRDSQAEQQVYADLLREANALVAQGDTYEMIRETNSQPDVMELIRRTWKTTGEVLDVSEACNLIEEELLNETLKYAKLKKVQSKFAPSVPEQSQPQRQIRTLTNRDTAQPQMSRRERAIAAATGTLKK